MRKYAIVDIETSGGLIKRDKIIEIAIVIHDGQRIISEFESLVDPGRSVSSQITMLTGITDEMLVGAPKFHQIARKIVEMTEGCIFVAHNARFDYSFIKKAFEDLGYTYTRKQLCTVRLSRMLNPNLKKHGLDSLAAFYGISNRDRHRAMGDVRATAAVLEKLLHQGAGPMIDELINYGIRASRLPSALSLEFLHDLPENCGVYYFHNEQGDVIYVGKSLNIKKRVMQHFADNTVKANKLAQRVHDITFEITGSELVALLLEEAEIKRLQPEVNRALRKKLFPFALYWYRDELGYHRLIAEKIKKTTPSGFEIVREYPRLSYAKGHLEGLIEEFQLCRHLCGDKTGSTFCFNYQIGHCLGACQGNEDAEAYNLRVARAIQFLRDNSRDSYCVIDPGREAEEKSVVLVEDGLVRGYGFVSGGVVFRQKEDIEEVVRPLPYSRDAQRIVHWYVTERKMEKLLPLSARIPK